VSGAGRDHRRHTRDEGHELRLSETLRTGRANCAWRAGECPAPSSIRAPRHEHSQHQEPALAAADYDADTAVQRELVLRLASILWPLRRSTAIESALFDAMAGERPSPVSSNRAAGNVIAIHCSRAASANPSSTYAAENALAEFVCAPEDLAKAFVRLTAHGTFPLDRLSRYEHTLWRQARQIICTLRNSGQSQLVLKRYVHFP